MRKRITSIIIALCMILSCVAAAGFTVSAASTLIADVAAAIDLATSAENYGLAKNIEDGNILHCFNWTLNQIKEELPNIAKAGFTAVQTSPLQPHVDTGAWYWLYQPTNSTVGNELGDYNALKSLCTEAHKYGVKVVVDVVANHLAGWNDGRWNDNIDGSWRNGDYYHNQGGCENWDNRYDVTHKNIGMPDLNSEHQEVQRRFSEMAKGLKSAGVDGVRWDAAKHIGLPSEGCGFWSSIAGVGMYNYGEILDNPAGNSGDDYNNSLIQEYANYIGVTDSSYSGHVTGCVRDGRADGQTGNWVNRGVPANRCVYWAESHDTYCNNGWTNSLSESIIDRSYAVLGARANSQSLYFARPYERNHDSIRYAVKGSTHFTSKQVAAVNHFHNAMVGTGEYFLADNGCFVICRGGGAVIVSPSGSNFDITVQNGGGMVPSGTYTDEVSGSTWYVNGGSISGHIGDSGIVVIYNQPAASPSVHVNPGDSTYKTDSISVTLNYSNATSGTYSIDGGSFKSFYNGQTITIGAGKSYGTKTTLTVRATNGSATDQATYTYTKVDPNATQTVYFNNSSYRWSEVYCYIYADNNGNIISNGAWPGAKMTQGADNIWYYDVPMGLDRGRAIFTENSGNNDHRYPGDGDPGLDLNGNSYIFGDNHSWTVYSGGSVKPVQPTQPSTQKPTQIDVDPTAPVTAYFNNAVYNWSDVYCYIYDDSNGNIVSNGDWPGARMTQGTDNIWYYAVPQNLRNGKIIFTENSGNNDHRYPGDGAPGLDINGISSIFGENHSWTAYSGGSVNPVQPTQPQTQKPTNPSQPQTPSSTPGGRILVGDADEDGKVTIFDATRIQRALAGFTKLSAYATACADTDRDGKITVIDATRIQRHLAGLFIADSVVGQYIGGTTPVQPSDPTNPPVNPTPGNGVTLNASATATGDEVWYAWTWGSGEGRWIKGSGDASAIVFTDVDSSIIFVRANPGMDIDWNNGSVWNQTDDLTTSFGHTFTTNGWASNRMLGDWS